MPLIALSPSAKCMLPRQRDVSAMAFMDEAKAVKILLNELGFLDKLEPAIRKDSQRMITALRKEGPADGLEGFLQEYGLDSEEGVAVMGLAEALLRIPDAATADRLIHDKFESAHWEKHVGHSGSFLVNASSWGLLLTGKIVHLSEADGPAAFLSKLAGRIGEPVVREALKAAMRFIGQQFVLGETTAQALQRSHEWKEKGFRFSYDILGEGARSQAQSSACMEAYRQAIALIGKEAKSLPLHAAPSISVKLSALHPRYQLLKYKRLYAELLPRLKELCQLAMQHNICVAIDAEEATRMDIEMLLFAELFFDPAFARWNGLGFVVQAYQKRAFYLIDYLRDMATQCGKVIPVRLVKGAYWDSEIKAAQIAGLPSYPVFTRKTHTDVSYLACASKLLAHECFFSQFATHNARTIASIQAMARHFNVSNDRFEFQRLHGMGEKLHDMVVQQYPSRIYAPIGQHKDLLAYLIRRLLENGASTSFVNLLLDENITLEELLENPVANANQTHGAPHPAIPQPIAMYGTRKNSQGIDLGNLVACETLEKALDGLGDTTWSSGSDRDTSSKELSLILESATRAFPGWAGTPVAKRCDIIESIADAIEKHQAEALALLARESGKTIADAIAEVREAADFCRYYASEARTLLAAPRALAGPTGESNRLALYPRGVFACISPWNFPLAIFSGQIVAALACGNCVIAKPAEQTPRIAAWAVKLMHAAGIPHDVLQLAQGRGETVGATLIKESRVHGVVFTGSTETARAINQSLAVRGGPIAPFIAETGGINCMVVDSSALLEQAVDNIISSAFGSAGQRCSALRVLYVQEDIANELLSLLKGAMQELTVGLPSVFSTDIGPVIDEVARDMLMAHIHNMKKEATLIAATPLPKESGYFVTPHAFEIKSIRQITREVFGPILHVIRFKSSQLAQVADDINSTGFGLTFGIESRIEDTIAFFTSRIRAGNMYINRSMIGATVGVQPFGGEGLSGTGPKAGGPYYLLKFLSERTISNNTAAIGGNLALLSG